MLRRPDIWFLFAVIAAFSIGGFFVVSRGDQYRDRIACENFQAERVQVQAGSGLFYVHYPDGRRVTVSGKCLAEFDVIAEAKK